MQKTAAIATLAALTGADAFMTTGPMGLRASPAPAISRAKIGGIKMQATDEVCAPFPLPAAFTLLALAFDRRLGPGYSNAWRHGLLQDLFRVVLSGRGREHAKDARAKAPSSATGARAQRRHPRSEFEKFQASHVMAAVRAVDYSFWLAANSHFLPFEPMPNASTALMFSTLSCFRKWPLAPRRRSFQQALLIPRRSLATVRSARFCRTDTLSSWSTRFSSACRASTLLV